jgi:hypothetical protein
MIMSHAFSLMAALVTVAPPGADGSGKAADEGQVVSTGAASSPIGSTPAPFRIERGPEHLPLLVPRDEELVYLVTLDLGVLGSPMVGRVTITSKVKPYQPDLMLRNAASAHDASSGGPEMETAIIEACARGGYAVYDLEETITCTLLPQRWPSMIHRQVQTGSENRKREVMFGWREGVFSSSYRRDRHCRKCDLRAHFIEPRWAWQDERHCKKCARAEHRVWRNTVFRKAPEESVDMLGGVFLARSMLQLGQERARFPLLAKDVLWKVKIAQGEKRKQTVPAGTFDAVEVELVTEVPAGEPRDDDRTQFAGLFGIHGTLSIWMHPSGVPVRIRGQVPIGPINLDVSIKLQSYRGTPSEFRATRGPG